MLLCFKALELNNTDRRAPDCWIGWRKQNRADDPVSYLDTLIKTGSESIEAILRRKRILSRDLWRAWRIRNCRSAWFLENWWGARAAWGARKKNGCGVSWTTSELSASTPTSGRRSLGRGEMTQDGGTRGVERFMAEWIAAEKARARLRHAVACPDVTGRTKERIAQRKRARAGSLATVD